MMKRFLFTAGLALLGAVGAGAETPAPSGGEPVLAPDALARFRVEGDVPGAGRAEWVAVEGRAFSHAWRIRTERQPADPWKLQISSVSDAPVKRGDVLWVRFFLRGPESRNESGEGQTTFVFETDDEAHAKSIDLTVGARGEWREFLFPFVCRHDLPAGGAKISFRAGFRPQVIEVAGLELLNYRRTRAVADLPRTRADYPGRAADAPWRKAAAERIERIRKADLAVRVTDAAGRPVADATVEVEQTRHAFGFGSAVDGLLLTGTNADSARYREIVRTYFSKVVWENELKWQPWVSGRERRRPRTLESMDWLEKEGIRQRGHVLVWPSWGNMLPGLRELEKQPEALQARILERITEMMTLTRGRFEDWDVINEPYAHNDAMRVLGDEAMVAWFRRAHEVDPACRLFLNDYAGLAADGMNTRHKDHFERTARFLRDKGAPIAGLGLQCHFGWSVTAPERALAELDRWHALGLTIHITEFDIETTDEELQADYTRDLLTLAFSHPGVSAVMMWGFWEGRHWRPDAAMWRRDWSLKPNGAAWIGLTHKAWWTRDSGNTGSEGGWSCRAFQGEHRVRARAGGRSGAATVKLPAEGAAVTIVVE